MYFLKVERDYVEKQVDSNMYITFFKAMDKNVQYLSDS